MDLHAWIVERVEEVERLLQLNLRSSDEAPSVRRRCEADRRVLARHRLATEWTWQRDPACHGCGTDGDCDDPVTENINDCPELLDLAHAHGMTDGILAALDRPQPAPRPAPSGRLGYDDLFAPRTPTSAVPAALRGPRWKPDRGEAAHG
ncbi:hypothetical protein [Streptomyces sp. NPDC001054]